MPSVFVLLWSTGFIGAKYGLPYAEPFTFLFYRLITVSFLLYLILQIMGQSFPTDKQLIGHVAVSGLLVHAGYLGGVFAAIKIGMPSGLAALIVGLQPLLTAVAASFFLREIITRLQWIGLFLGLLGVAFVLSERFTPNTAHFDITAIFWATLALFSISLGTVYHKRFCTGMELISGTLIQYLAATVVLGAIAFTTETMVVTWNLSFILALAWLVLGLSLGAISLLMLLIKQGAAARVASLFYLVPPVTALEAFILFDEKLGVFALCGMALTVIGVALVVVKKRPL
ncbi:EamA family transporter [Beggiatoa leptomitoformis]|uniref:EamA family transporter n=2 Tax=Beggiatoa leptomitoformis TaxID=288004 RepID=A0A2N9YJL5_9GAMM|nr:EamA family transporter [Beggiatoa leptomitoformis]AUI70692.1 EamA family transporter [Beggiatoa leptomitoformis]